MNQQAGGLHWDLEPGLVFLNHGSFGLAPRQLLDWRWAELKVIERDPVAYLVDRLPAKLQAARCCLAQLLGAQPDQLAFVPSTTYGLNELLQRLQLLVDDLPPGSEILMLDHGYNATVNLVRFAAEQQGCTVRLVSLPSPLEEPAQVLQALDQAWRPSTRLLVVDHITSPTALVMPLKEIIALAHSRDAWVIVDGAHAPGLLSVGLDELRPDAYVGNLHKWLCCPRGAAFLWVQHHWQQRLRPLVISHGANAPVANLEDRFQREHDWIGTADPTPWLALPEAIRCFTRPMHQNAARAQRARTWIQESLNRVGLGMKAPEQSSFPPIAMASIALPGADRLDGAALQRQLLVLGFQVPVIPLQPHRSDAPQFLRVSCFDYNDDADCSSLAEVVGDVARQHLV
jgi:isopenicillin-N epimerase